MGEEEWEEVLMHIGVIRRSGRYPWGSGDNPYQRSQNFKSFYDAMKDEGMSDKEIADYIQDYARQTDPHAAFSTTDLRARIAIDTEVIRQENINRAVYLRDQQKMSNVAIAEALLGSKSKEPTIRGWLKNYEEGKQGSIEATANAIKEQHKTKPFLDVGKGNNLYLGVTYTKMMTALQKLRDEGFEIHPIKIPQLFSDKMTNAQVLCAPGTSWSEARKAVIEEGRLQIMTTQSDDGGATFRTPNPLPRSVSSKQIEVRYKEDGGGTMDGVIEIRRGVPEMDLGASRYAQVRIAVDGTHFMKGMAMYADDLPDGVNIRYNSAKTKVEAPNKTDTMKPLKRTKEGEIDERAPFGSTTTSRVYIDKNGKEQTSVLNPVGGKNSMNIEGRWDQWSNSLSSQMLSKQPVQLASRQLGEARTAKQKDLDEILALTNPVVRKKLLDEFADSADAAAVHLKAASLPRQANRVLLPLNAMRPHEIYAPEFNSGEKVVLIRHPHGGPFEIPELTVNNNNRTAKKILGDARDAVGIHYTVAEVLSGADFDGDSVLVIPNPTGAVKTKPPLQDLKGFDAKDAYKIADDDTTTVRMTKKNTQMEMGRISNLITDMTILGAGESEIARAVKHSMVVIDAEKHGLDYKRSAKDFQISQLKKEYQGGSTSGAATIISRAKSELTIPQRKRISGARGIDPVTGERLYENTNRTYPKRDKDGNVVNPAEPRTSKVSKMDYADDARTLMSKNPKPMEEVYAAHANAMKALGNRARLESLNLYKNLPKENPDAKKHYASEVESLNTKLEIALRNAPRERRAQALGNTMAKQRIDDDPLIDKDGIKKIKWQSQEEARRITGADKDKVVITDREWEAIQARALSPSKLRDILDQADMKRVKALATPRYNSSLTPGQIQKAKMMEASGKSLKDIAEALGIPRSTIADNLANG